MADAEALFVLHQSRVFRYVCRAVGHVEAARDLTQDVFLRVSRAAPPTGSAHDQRGWLFSIARNIVIDYRRREQRA
jgi:RNA polymerase sigma-70 factor (ECF subfamily)